MSRVLRPEILLAALRIDSTYNPKLIQKLRVFIETPKISVHLVNHFTYGGKSKLKLYSTLCAGVYGYR